MNTYLFTWNPKKWDWTALEKDIKSISKEGSVTKRWSCATNFKQIKPGDRAFLVKLGAKKPNGIIGSGYVASKPYIDKHWDGSNKLMHYVTIDFEVLMKGDEIYDLQNLKTGKLSKQNWTPNPSGFTVQPKICDDLESVWFDFLNSQKIKYNPFTSIVEDESTYTEGTPYQVTVTKYERNPHARKKCLEYYGPTCVVCTFNFEKTYGAVANDFIHIHHLAKISSVGKMHNVDPIVDLNPVCPNCHSIIHKRNPPYSIEEMKAFLKIN